jgi:hypothetical protein
MAEEKFNAVKYRNNYDREHYDKMLLSFPKGSKDLIKSKAQESGKSVSQYILDLVKDN